MRRVPSPGRWPTTTPGGAASATSSPSAAKTAAVSPGSETISYAAYQQAIERPLRAFLAAHANIDFIVLTKGVPIRIADAPGRGLGNHRPSLDSYLASLDYEKTPGAASVHIVDSGFTGTAWANRFWNSSEPFSHAKFGGRLVARLDGYTEADAKALTSRAWPRRSRRESLAPGNIILLDACPAFGFADRKKQPRPIFVSPPAAGKEPTIVELNFNEYNADMQHAADLLRGRSAGRVDPNGRLHGKPQRPAGILSLSYPPCTATVSFS